jgi:hypothetical protein
MQSESRVFEQYRVAKMASSNCSRGEGSLSILILYADFSGPVPDLGTPAFAPKLDQIISKRLS